MATRFINPPTHFKGPTFTHVVEVTGPVRTVYLSGQTALNKDGSIVDGRADFRAHATKVMENIKSALGSVGAGFGDIVKMTIYLVDMDQVMTLREVRAQYFTSPNPPASALIPVARLGRPEALLEIDVTAVIPDKPAKPARKKASAETAKAKSARSKRKPKR